MKPLAGKKVLFVICQENFRDEELAHPREEVANAGASVSVAAREKTPAKGMLGAVFLAKPVVVSGKVVTANGPPAAREFGKALVSTISGD